MPLTSPAAPPRARRGFSLLEILVVIILLGLVMGVMLRLVVRQQRFYRGANAVMETRSQLRQAAALLPMQVRSTAPAVGTVAGPATTSDFLVLADSALELRATVGSSIVCTKVSTTQIELPPTTLASGNVLSSWWTAPQANDALFVYDDAGDGAADDGWFMTRITAVASGTGYCAPAQGFTTAADAAEPRLLLTVSPALPATVIQGAPIRFVRQARFSFYQSGDEQWYLGYREVPPGSSAALSTIAIQPVSGPYRPFSTDTSETGVLFRYFTANGAQITGTTLADRMAVARVQLTVRGATDQTMSSAGGANVTTYDLQDVAMAVRNRN